jgi:hypothetical protein
MTIGVNRHEQVAGYSVVATGTTNYDRSNLNCRGVHLVIDTTTMTGAGPTLTVTIQGKDPTSGKFYNILASAAIATATTTVLKVYPGLTAAANLVANDVLPREWRVVAVAGGTLTAIAATISANLIH